jgi:Family of unknown function (DUF6492)
MSPSGLPDRDPTETDALIRRIEACPIPRRTPRIDPPIHARLSASDPLREGIIGGGGAYAVRRLLSSLGFDEHRAMSWRLEHKLILASVFERYVPGALPRTWGLGSLVGALGPVSLRGALAAALPTGAFIKKTLGCLSGDRGAADATRTILDVLERGDDLSPPGPGLADEEWIVQERIEIARELRVHTMEDFVLEGFTSLRYRPGVVPDDRAVVEEFVQSILDRLPDGIVGESLWGWDVGVDARGRLRVIEVNLAGFHPVCCRGFQCSGFFQDHAVGPQLLADLFARVAEAYGVEVEIPEEDPGDLANSRGYLDVVRRRTVAWTSKPKATFVPPPPPPSSSPERIDAMLHLNDRGVGRFAILKRSMETFLGPLGTCWVVTPDAQFEPIAARFVSHRFEFVRESDVLGELKTREPASPLCRSQAARLAMAAHRVEADFLLDLTPDTICTRPVKMEDLVRGGRSTWSRSIGPAHSEFYGTAERLLGTERSGFVYGDPPGVLNRAVLVSLIDHLESRAAGDGPPGSRWPGLLLGEPSWSLVSLYFTFLDALDRVAVHHIPTSSPFAGHAIWSEKDWPAWDARAAFAPDAMHTFTILRTGHGIPPEEIWDRVGPYIGAPSMVPALPRIPAV